MNASIRISLIIFFLFLTVNLLSQNTFENGYVITNSNDTIFGFVKDRKPELFGKLYKKVRFKGKKKSIFAQKLSPYDIKEYNQGGRVYESKWMKVDRLFLKEDYRCIEGYGKKVFLRIIIKGKLTYYQWEYEDGESGYIDGINLFQKQNEKIYMKATQGIFGLRKDKLAAYLIDCQELSKMFLRKQIKDPISVVEFYNECVE